MAVKTHHGSLSPSQPLSFRWTPARKSDWALQIRLPEESLEGARLVEQVIYVIKEGEVAVRLENPIRRGEQKGKDVYLAPLGREERFRLHPSDNVMQVERSVEQRRR